MAELSAKARGELEIRLTYCQQKLIELKVRFDNIVAIGNWSIDDRSLINKFKAQMSSLSEPAQSIIKVLPLINDNYQLA